MRVLVTGADGQLGRAIARVFARHEVLSFGRNSIDITDFDAVASTLDSVVPAAVVNAAAYTDVDGAESPEGREAAFRANALGPRNLAVATFERDLPLLHVSTDYVFDGRAACPYHEYDRPDPRSVYGASKLAGECAVRAHNPRHYIARTAWLYDHGAENFPSTMLSLAERKEVRVVSDQYGSPTFAPHLAVGLEKLLDSGAYGTYHLAGGGGASWYELTRALYELAGIETPVRAVSTADFPRPAERPRYAVLRSIQSPHLELPPWREGLAEFVRLERGSPRS